MTGNAGISLALLFLLVSSLAYADDAENTINIFLGSGDLAGQRAAFDKIAASPGKYLPLVRNRLASIASGQFKTTEQSRSLDRLFYLAAFIKDKSLVSPIEKLWKDTDFLPDYCVYSCPIVFALTIYATSDLWTPPETMGKALDRHEDLYAEIRTASEISLEPTPYKDRARGPGIDTYLEEMANKPERELIEKAGPETQESRVGLAAAFQLAYSVSSSENLKDLYWLAIQEPKPDGACEGRWAIYIAIYRAEKAGRMGR